MKKETLIILSLIALVLVFGNMFALVCTKYAWRECTQWNTEYDTCYQTCTRTITDCNKCGYDAYLYETYYDGFKAQTPIYSPGSDYRVHWIVYTDSSYTTIKCHGWTDYGGTSITTCEGYLQRVVWRKECKTCQETYQCNPYQCNPRQVCINYASRQGETCPQGAIDCQCIQQIESCGNGACEPQYNENEQTCAVDCKKAICTPGELKCDGNILRMCSPDGMEWQFKENCLYGCENNICKQLICQEGSTKTVTCSNNQVIITEKCINNKWTSTGAICSSQNESYIQPPQCTTNSECDDGDNCTNDVCVNNVCYNTPIPGCTPNVEEEGFYILLGVFVVILILIFIIKSL